MLFVLNSGIPREYGRSGLALARARDAVLLLLARLLAVHAFRWRFVQ